MARRKQQPEHFVRSTCPYCGVGCGVEAGVKGGRIVAIRGDKRHPANLGRLCPKPAGLPEAVHHPDRLTHPLRRREDGGFARVSWEEALEEISCRLDDVLRCEGPESLGFYISGHLLTEDQYPAIKLARGYLGTPNVASTSDPGTGYEDAFGADGPPAAYSDITYAECIVLWGSSLAEHHPVTFDRVRRRKKDPDVSVVVVDPRRTPTAELADCFLQIRPGTDLALANAMLRVLLDEGLVDRTFVERYTSGFEAVAEVAAEWTPRRAARVCGVEASDVVGAARRFGEARASLALWTAGVNQGSAGDTSNRAIINLCLATGNVGKVGAGPFSLPASPTPWAIERPAGSPTSSPATGAWTTPYTGPRSRRRWGVDPGSIPGGTWPSGDGALPGRLTKDASKALWVAGTNPAVSMPTPRHGSSGGWATLSWSSRTPVPDGDDAPGGSHPAGGGLGREGRHDDQLRAQGEHRREARRAAGRGTGGLGDLCWRGPQDGLRRGLRVG